MPTTIQPKRVDRVHGVRKIRDNSNADAQRKSGNDISEHSGLQNSQRSECYEEIPASCSSFGVDLTGITFPSKLGYHIFSQYQTKVNFSLEEKRRALMLYSCIRHLPEFIDKQFSNVNDAVAYVYQEAGRIIESPYGFINDADLKRETPKEYYLQIIYDEIDSTRGRWQSYDCIDRRTMDDLPLRKAIYMCMKLIICEFGFTMFDKSGDDTLMDIQCFQEWQREPISENLAYAHEAFQKKHLRPYNSELDADTEEGMDISSELVKLDEVDEIGEKYENIAWPLQKRIFKVKPNLKFLKQQAEIHKNEDVGKWISHVLYLESQNFNINNYVAASYKDIDESYDEESIMPTSAFGYVFDGDDAYITEMDAAFNENVNNSLIVPFCIHTTICPDRGIIYTSPVVPLGSWIKKIISFSFANLKYETYK